MRPLNSNSQSGSVVLAFEILSWEEGLGCLGATGCRSWWTSHRGVELGDLLTWRSETLADSAGMLPDTKWFLLARVILHKWFSHSVIAIHSDALEVRS